MRGRNTHFLPHRSPPPKCRGYGAALAAWIGASQVNRKVPVPILAQQVGPGRLRFRRAQERRFIEQLSPLCERDERCLHFIDAGAGNAIRRFDRSYLRHYGGNGSVPFFLDGHGASAYS